MLRKHECFLSRENDTLPLTLCHTENVMLTWVLSIKGKWYTTTRPLSHWKCYANMSAFHQGRMIHCHSPFVALKMLCEHKCFPSRENDTLPLTLCHTENVMRTWVLSVEGKWYTATHPLSHWKWHVNMSAFYRGKMIHCHSPFVALKMSCEHECFPLRENDTPPLTLCRTENVMQTWVLSVKGKWYTATHPLSHRKCCANMGAFRRGKMIHHHLPFITKKMLGYNLSISHQKNGVWKLIFCPMGKWLPQRNLLYHKESWTFSKVKIT